MLDQKIELKGISTVDQVAEIFTKALVKPKFESFRVALGVLDRKHALRGSVKNQCILLLNLPCQQISSYFVEHKVNQFQIQLEVFYVVLADYLVVNFL